MLLKGRREGGDNLLPQHPLRDRQPLFAYSPCEGRKEKARGKFPLNPRLSFSLSLTSTCSRSLRYTKGGSLDSRYGQSATSVAATAFPVYLTTAAGPGPGSAATGTAVQVVPILTAQALQPPPLPNAADEGERKCIVWPFAHPSRRVASAICEDHGAEFLSRPSLHVRPARESPHSCCHETRVNLSGLEIAKGEMEGARLN